MLDRHLINNAIIQITMQIKFRKKMVNYILPGRKMADWHSRVAGHHISHLYYQYLELGLQ